MTPKVTHINFARYQVCQKKLRFVCRHLVNLQYLEFQCVSPRKDIVYSQTFAIDANYIIFQGVYELSDYLPKLTNLTKLNEVNIYVNIEISRQSNFDQSIQINLVPLPSVKKLFLRDYAIHDGIGFDGRAWCEAIRATFTNLEQLVLHNSSLYRMNAIKSHQALLDNCKCYIFRD